MGLDMFLTGEAFFSYAYEPKPTFEGHEIEEHKIKLGYWRKEPNLHDFIIETFNNGVDDCSEIYLDVEKLKVIHEAIKNDELPHTEGFFFGASTFHRRNDETLSEEDRDYCNQQYNLALKQVEDAIKFLEEETDNVWKSVVYRASW